jgi:hypothetical protein
MPKKVLAKKFITFSNNFQKDKQQSPKEVYTKNATVAEIIEEASDNSDLENNSEYIQSDYNVSKIVQPSRTGILLSNSM